MKTIFKTNDYKVTFNGKSTYIVETRHGDALFATNTERKAMNFMNRTLKDAGK
jgi:hypothetical protein